MHKYWLFTKLNMQNVFAYRGPLLIWLINNIISVLVLTSIWSSASGTTFGSYQRKELIGYYVVSLFLQWVIGWYPFWEVFNTIKDGSIIFNMGKPISVVKSYFFMELGWHIPSALIGFFASLLIAISMWQSISIPISFVNGILIIPAMFLAATLTFITSYSMGLMAFWFTDVGALNSVYSMGKDVLGGQWIPVSFIPVTFRTIVNLLPFRYMFSFPLEIAFNKVNCQEIVIGFITGFLWLVIFYLIYRLMWQKGRKSYSAFGN